MPLEDWQLQTAINNYIEACEQDAPDIIRHAKILQKTAGKARRFEQQKSFYEQLVPLLDDTRPHVRQITACIIMGTKITPLSTMPPELEIEVERNPGRVGYIREWKNHVPEDVQRQGWRKFVERHKAYLRQESSDPSWGHQH